MTKMIEHVDILILLVTVIYCFGLIVNGSSTDSQFKLDDVCEGTHYATTLNNISYVRSEVHCASFCNVDTSCLSFIYDDVTGHCVTSDEILITSSACVILLRYGEKVVEEVRRRLLYSVVHSQRFGHSYGFYHSTLFKHS